MILIDPAIQTTFGRTLRRRELTAFLREAQQSAGLRGSVSLLLTGDDHIRQLNRDFRRKNKPTDVLSFPAPEIPGLKSPSVGDLAISVETAARQADGLGHPLASELKILTLHGLLHLAGYDHETDSGEMARKEALLRKRLGLAAGLIERTANGHAPEKQSPKKHPAKTSRTALKNAGRQSITRKSAAR
jgi:probable rRNA maturation factor